jgi:hypothetical protein
VRYRANQARVDNFVPPLDVLEKMNNRTLISFALLATLLFSACSTLDHQFQETAYSKATIKEFTLTEDVTVEKKGNLTDFHSRKIHLKAGVYRPVNSSGPYIHYRHINGEGLVDNRKWRSGIYWHKGHEDPMGCYYYIGDELFPVVVKTEQFNSLIVSSTDEPEERKNRNKRITEFEGLFGEKINGITLSCKKPYTLTQGCSSLTGPKERIQHQPVKGKLAGTENGEIVILMKSSAFTQEYELKNQAVNCIEILVQAGITVREIRPVISLGQTMGYAFITNGDAFGLLTIKNSHTE